MCEDTAVPYYILCSFTDTIVTGSPSCMKNAYCNTMCRCWMATQPGHMLLLCHAAIVSVWSKVQIVGAFPSFSDMGLKIVDQAYSEGAWYFMVRFQKMEWLCYVLFRMLCTVEVFLQYFEGFIPFFFPSQENITTYTHHCVWYGLDSDPALTFLRARFWLLYSDWTNPNCLC